MGLFLPSAAVERVIDITPELLRKLGVRGLILDVDNTLAEHGSPQPFAGTIEWSRRMADAGFGLIILSNNTHERVAPFAGRYRIPFLSMCMKPLPFAYWRGARRLGTKCRETAVVGDQIFTRMRSILLTPVSEEKSLSFRIRRRLEKGIRRRIRQKGLGPEK